MVGYALFGWAEKVTRVGAMAVTKELRALYGVAAKSWLLRYKLWMVSDIMLGFSS